jgi:hypothetical protein
MIFAFIIASFSLLSRGRADVGHIVLFFSRFSLLHFEKAFCRFAFFARFATDALTSYRARA